MMEKEKLGQQINALMEDPMFKEGFKLFMEDYKAKVSSSLSAYKSLSPEGMVESCKEVLNSNEIALDFKVNALLESLSLGIDNYMKKHKSHLAKYLRIVKELQEQLS